MSGTRNGISVIGLGKLGAPLVACLASKGYRVTGVDVDEAKVRAFREKRSPVYETGLDELIAQHAGNIDATTDTAAAIGASDATFLVTATPSEPGGGFSLKYVLPVCETVGKALKAKSGWHLLVLTSTVMPGSTGGPVREALEQASGKRCGKDFGLCYSPEFIALGSVIRDFLNPDFVLIGESDPKAGDALQAIYDRVCNKPRAARMNFVNAELTKLSVNTYVTTKISYANMLAAICGRLAQADVDVVTQAIGMDTRIGTKYLKGALGYGGPCFPRDNKAFAALGRMLEVPATLAEATDRANDEVIVRLVQRIKGALHGGDTIGILGLSYKPNTDVVEASQGLLLAKALVAEKFPVIVHDPAGLAHAKRELGDSVRYAESGLECAAQCEVAVIATAWDEYRRLSPETIRKAGKPRVIVDAWRVLDANAFKGVADFMAIGRGPAK